MRAPTDPPPESAGEDMHAGEEGADGFGGGGSGG